MKMELTVPNMKHHVNQMCERFSVKLIEDPDLRREDAGAYVVVVPKVVAMFMGYENSEIPIVHTAPIRDETGYVIAMHELGHIIAPNGQSNVEPPPPGCHPRVRFEYYRKKLIAEEAAWEWAEYFVRQMFDWTIAMEQVKEYGLKGYRDARRLGQ